MGRVEEIQDLGLRYDALQKGRQDEFHRLKTKSFQYLGCCPGHYDKRLRLLAPGVSIKLSVCYGSSGRP